jgi:hypothetical protein
MPSLRPRVGVPRGIRLAFAAPAIAVFAVFALVGFYAALIPSLLSNVMGISNRAVGGFIAFEMIVVAAVAVPLVQRLASRTAMTSGLLIFLPSLLFLGLAEFLASLPLLLLATAIGGVAAALGYRGSLQVVNEIAPTDRRAEVVSAYFAIGFAGNAIPVIGVGVLSSLAGYVVASLAFAVLLAFLAITAMLAGLRFGNE